MKHSISIPDELSQRMKEEASNDPRFSGMESRLVSEALRHYFRQVDQANKPRKFRICAEFELEEITNN